MKGLESHTEKDKKKMKGKALFRQPIYPSLQQQHHHQRMPRKFSMKMYSDVTCPFHSNPGVC
ncbi:hypothetical protein U0070_008370 [Myodes glareolus]|uniref:Uncharacterized protein n=1 Tax=Myodes glareolus TaxID=447135 RepID=A0AAW0IY24_MYOGA